MPHTPLETLDELGDCCDINWEWDYTCDESGCLQEGICRCGRVVGFRFDSVDTWQMARLTIGKTDDPLLTYAVERALTVASIWDKECWEANTSSGYYGEEADGVDLIQEARETVVDHVTRVCAQRSVDDAIRESLRLEYGFVLPELEDAHFVTETIDRAAIILGAPGQARLVGSRDVGHYVDYPGPRALVLDQRDGTYRLIDGHHRLTAWRLAQVPVCVATRRRSARAPLPPARLRGRSPEAILASRRPASR